MAPKKLRKLGELRLKTMVFILVSCLVIVYSTKYIPPSKTDAEYLAWQTKRAQDIRENQSRSSEIFDSQFRFFGLEMVVASPGQAYYSRVGHVMLRLVGTESAIRSLDEKKDLLLSALPDIDDFKVNDFKAMYGGYAVNLIIKSFQEQWNAYVGTEKRNLSRWLIQSSATQRNRLTETIKHWLTEPHSVKPFTYFNNNCVGALSHLLREAGIPAPEGVGLMPLSLKERYEEAGLQTRKIETHVPIDQISWLSDESLPRSAYQLTHSELDPSK